MPAVASWDQQSWQQRDYPPSAIRVDIVALPVEEGVSERPPQAVDAKLDTNEAWQFGYSFDPALGPARNHVVVADNKGYRYILAGWFADDNPHEATFFGIVSSFRFTN
jgi:hypothetical protein